jgi:uncharacterized protein
MIMLALGAALSLLAGLSLGLLGGGGSLLTLPILVYVLGVEPRAAIATSLVVVGATSACSVTVHARAGLVEWRVGLIFGAAGMAGAAFGGRLGKLLPAGVLLVAFGAVVLAAAMAMLRERRAAAPAPAPSSASRLRCALRDGFGVGILTGTLGAGGGFLVVPALVLFGGLGMSRAVATSLLVITMNAVSGLVSASVGGAAVDLHLACGMAAASIVGSLFGARLGRTMRPESLRKGFGVFIISLGAFILARELAALLHVPPARATALAGAIATAVLALAGGRLMTGTGSTRAYSAAAGASGAVIPRGRGSSPVALPHPAGGPIPPAHCPPGASGSMSPGSGTSRRDGPG